MAHHASARTVVIGAASRHGSTTEIAARMQHTMQEHLSPQWDVQLTDLSDLDAFEGADAVVLGSAIYLGHWMRSAKKALHALKDVPLLDLWLFSTGPITDGATENTPIVAADVMVELGFATDHMVFAGRLVPAQLAWWERLVVQAVGASSSDHRDWEAVDQWAAGIARQLTSAVETSELRL